MGYYSRSIKDVIEDIGTGDYYLPAIQRKFVWKPQQIEGLFDSIIKGYPIGTFLFWDVRKPHINDYVFYKFIQEYHEKNNYRNEITPSPKMKDNITGVLDGQQRLSSMYIALQGSYSYKKKYLSWNNPNAFPARRLHVDILGEFNKSNQENGGEFKFISVEQIENQEDGKFWLDIRTVLKWDKDPPIDEFYEELFDNYQNTKLEPNLLSKRTHIKSVLRKLHSRLVIEELINYFEIKEQDLDNILQIFVRVNSGGTVLSKTDLLFSTIIATWEKGRDEIENFIDDINSWGDGFRFDNDFIMRCCLVLTDCPVVFKVGSFRSDNVVKIKNSWPKIRDAIGETVRLLVKFGFNGQNLTSQNAIILIAYYILKGGKINSKTEQEFRYYIIHSLLKNIYGGQGDTVLSNLRNGLRIKDNQESELAYKLKSNNFEFSQLFKAKLPSNKSFRITEDDINEFLEYKKGTNTFLILSLLYPDLRYGHVKFHQDHIHPAALFSTAKLNKYGIDESKHELWFLLKDQLPNLQLLEGRENEMKNKTPLVEWIYGNDRNGKANVENIEVFYRRNYFPENQSLELEYFEEFFQERKKLLKIKLSKNIYIQKS
jgi:uncharacterized protein with ParB-like and HNH nuclease domain